MTVSVLVSSLVLVNWFQEKNMIFFLDSAIIVYPQYHLVLGMNGEHMA